MTRSNENKITRFGKKELACCLLYLLDNKKARNLILQDSHSGLMYGSHMQMLLMTGFEIVLKYLLFNVKCTQQDYLYKFSKNTHFDTFVYLKKPQTPDSNYGSAFRLICHLV
jgi:hypothetical protein